MVAAQKEKTAAQEEIPVDWAHMDGLIRAMVEMRKTFEGLWFECHVKQSFYLYILIVLTVKYKPLPRKLCTGPQSIVQYKFFEPRNVLSYEFFKMICTFVIYYNKFSLVVQETTLGNSRIFKNAKHVKKKKSKCGIRDYLYVRVR